MIKAGWLAEWRKSAGEPVLYHVMRTGQAFSLRSGRSRFTFRKASFVEGLLAGAFGASSSFVSVLGFGLTTPLPAQTTSYVRSTTWMTAAQPGAVIEGHPRFLFRNGEAAGGDPFTDRYLQRYETSGDLRSGRMSGKANIQNVFQIPGRRTELKAHLQPRYRVELAPGNTVNAVIPVEWRARLRKYAVNFTDVASGGNDLASTSGRALFSVQSPSAGGILAQAIYHHQSSSSGEQGLDFDIAKTVQTAGAFEVDEKFVVDPVAGEILSYFKTATANNGNGYARIEHDPENESRNGFTDIYLTVRHNARSGNGLSYFIWLEMEAVASAYGAGSALVWDEFELSYVVPPGFRIVAVDGQDLSRLDASNATPTPFLSAHPITDSKWSPETKQFSLSFPGVDGLPLEVHETKDLSRWSTVRRIESSTASESIELHFPVFTDATGVPPEARFYRVVVPAE